jgi:hypothetical protein
MKKAFFTLTLLAVVTLLSAQTLQFEHNGHVYENGETIISPFNEAFQEYVTELNIRNLTNDDINVIMEQDVLETAEGIMMQFCWGLCMVGSGHLVSQPVAVPAQTLSEDIVALHCSFLEGETGVVKAIYHAYDQNNPDNKISIIVLYGQTANTPEYTFNLGQAYPNPATSQVHFDLQSNSNVDVTVYNLLGQEVKSQFVSEHQNRVKIAVDDLQPGIYFCRFSINGEVVKTEKFIVKH